MTFRHLFSRQSRLALSATPGRNLLTWGLWVAVAVAAWAWPDALPWWGWIGVLAAEIVGLAFLGRYWADKDLGLDSDDEAP
ncbi:hypothetical protein [Leifsonia poae]|uniref:hypothetical protein n=1 Tax=Leifsonia poae TaxID=110933 RepID=UPI003D6646C2